MLKSNGQPALPNGTKVQYFTGSRYGTNSHEGVIVEFVRTGEEAVHHFESERKRRSNRDRYVIRVGNKLRFANAALILAHKEIKHGSH